MSITSAALSAIGCWAEPKTRSFAVPTRYEAADISLIDQDRHDAARVVEDIEARSRFDDREERDDRSPGDQRLREKVDLVEPANRAGRQVERRGRS